jgi:hypothetical protein
MKTLIHRLLPTVALYQLDRRLAVDTSLRRAVLGSGVAISVVCYVLAITVR